MKKIILSLIILIIIAGGSYLYYSKSVSINISNEKFYIEVEDSGTKENSLTTDDTLKINWNNCNSEISIQLVTYIENSPHKTKSFVIGENIEATSFEYKIEPRIPSNIYRIWFSSNECGIGEYSDFVYITNTRPPFVKIISPDQYEGLYRGTLVKIRWDTEKKDQGRVRLGYRSPLIGERSNIHWITDYILARGYYDWKVPQNLLIDTDYMEIIIEDQETEETTGVYTFVD